MRSKASKKPVDERCLKVAALDITNDRIIAEWRLLPDFVLSCPIFHVCGVTCFRCFK